MTAPEAAAILAAGMAAGAINAIVGAGSLITFPTLLALGYAPVVANVSNTVGLVPGSVTGSLGYRRELAGQRQRVVRLGAVAILGGLTGATLLLALPPTAFESIVPYLILLAVALVAVQPRLSAALAQRRADGHQHTVPLAIGVYLVGIYGGYFGAAQGVMLIALLGIFLPDDLQRLNGLKNVLATLINAMAALLFILVAPIVWQVTILLAIGSSVGGVLGAVAARRLSPQVLRIAIVVVGTIVAARMLIG
jgi:uncharacterized membrane protein YfcA